MKKNHVIEVVLLYKGENALIINNNKKSYWNSILFKVYEKDNFFLRFNKGKKRNIKKDQNHDKYLSKRFDV